MKKKGLFKRILSILMVTATLLFLLSASALAMIASRHIVIYHPNNGTAEADVSDVSTSTTFTAKAADTFSAPGLLYHFEGWSLTEDGDVAYEAGVEFTVTKQTTDLYAVWKRLSLDLPSRYTVVYHPNNGTTEANVSDVSLLTTFTAKAADTFSTPGLLYYFDGWSLTEDGDAAYEAGETFTVTQRSTDLYATWKRAQTELPSYTVTYHANNGLGEGDLTDGPYLAGISVTTRGDGTYTLPAGMEFAGWSLTAGGGVEYYGGEAFAMPQKDVDLYAVWTSKPVLNRTDHIAYMQGYPDGTFGPARNMTRAEAVVMFSRLLTKQMDIDATYTSTYTDVPAGVWYANAIGYMQQHGVLSATASTFRPNDAITRAEFADLAVSFENLTSGAPNDFSDVPSGYWAYDQINYAVERGWLSGYPDGTFRPDNLITRAEVVTVTNRVLERYPDYDYIDSNTSVIKNYSDLTNTYWAYYNIIEASAGHDYTKFGTVETWLSVNSN